MIFVMIFFPIELHPSIPVSQSHNLFFHAPFEEKSGRGAKVECNFSRRPLRRLAEDSLWISPRHKSSIVKFVTSIAVV